MIAEALDGRREEPGTAVCQGNPRTVSLVARDEALTTTKCPADGLGLMDATHIVIHFDADSSLSVLDIGSTVLTPVQAHGFFAGMIPGAL